MGATAVLTGLLSSEHMSTFADRGLFAMGLLLSQLCQIWDFYLLICYLRDITLDIRKLIRSRFFFSYTVVVDDAKQTSAMGLLGLNNTTPWTTPSHLQAFLNFKSPKPHDNLPECVDAAFLQTSWPPGRLDAHTLIKKLTTWALRHAHCLPNSDHCFAMSHVACAIREAQLQARTFGAIAKQ